VTDAYASRPEWEVWLAFAHGRASIPAQVLKNVRLAFAREVHCFGCRIPMNPRRTHVFEAGEAHAVRPERLMILCGIMRAKAKRGAAA
jgi:hypothetical protein